MTVNLQVGQGDKSVSPNMRQQSPGEIRRNSDSVAQNQMIHRMLGSQSYADVDARGPWRRATGDHWPVAGGNGRKGNGSSKEDQTLRGPVRCSHSAWV